MKPKLALRLGVSVWWLSIVLGISLSLILEPSLPELLQPYITWNLEQDFASRDWIALFVGGPLILVEIVSSIGLFFFKPWAKLPFIISSLAGITLVAFLGPTVEHAYAMVFNYIESGAAGFIIAILLVTDVVTGDPVDA